MSRIYRTTQETGEHPFITLEATKIIVNVNTIPAKKFSLTRLIPPYYLRQRNPEEYLGIMWNQPLLLPQCKPYSPQCHQFIKLYQSLKMSLTRPLLQSHHSYSRDNASARPPMQNDGRFNSLRTRLPTILLTFHYLSPLKLILVIPI